MKYYPTIFFKYPKQLKKILSANFEFNNSEGLTTRKERCFVHKKELNVNRIAKYEDVFKEYQKQYFHLESEQHFCLLMPKFDIELRDEKKLNAHFTR